MAAGLPLTAERGGARRQRQVFNVLVKALTRDSGTAVHSSPRYLLIALNLNRLLARAAISCNGPQSALPWQGSNAAYEHEPGSQRRKQDPG